MFYRQPLDTDLSDLKTILRERTDGSTTSTLDKAKVDFRFTEGPLPVFRIDSAEVPVTETGLLAFGDHLGIPSPFLKRLTKTVDLDLQERLVNDLFDQSNGTQVRVQYSQAGVLSVGEPGKDPIDPVRLVQIAERVLGTSQAPVVRLVDEKSDFGFDVSVPEGYDRGIGGDPQVNDITAGGLRFGLDRKRGLAPWVQPFLYRLICTNGMETTTEGLKVDGRGQSVDEVLAEVEAMAQIAFAEVESDIEHFYSLRDQRVRNPERALRTMAIERNLPDRSTLQLLDLARGADLPDDPSMFDLTNLVTNFANSPTVRNDGGRLLLERAGGAIISDHASRCGHCRQRVQA